MKPILTAICRGQPRRTCDERCYNAKNETCTCICDGLNHGAGLAAATRHTTEQLLQIIERLEQTLPGYQYVIAHWQHPRNQTQLQFTFERNNPCLVTKSTSPPNPASESPEP